MARVYVRNYGRLAEDDLRLVPTSSTPHKKLHWQAAQVVDQIAEAWIEHCTDQISENWFDDETLLEEVIPLTIASGWRAHRWVSKSQYEKVIIAKYNKRKDLSCKKGNPPIPCLCYKQPKPPRSRCLWLAFDSAHETGLAWDYGSCGLIPNSKTIKAQKKSDVFNWLCEYAKLFNEAQSDIELSNYSPEPWHWEIIIPPEMWEMNP